MSDQTKEKKFLKKRPAKIAAGTLAICAVMTAGIMFTSMHDSDIGYAVSINGEQVATLASKDEAAEAVGLVVDEFSPEESDVKAVTTEAIDVSVCDKEKPEGDKVSPEVAASAITEALTSDNADAEMRIVSTATEVRSFTPEPNYIKDDTMLAGQSRVENEAEDGQKEIRITYTTVNGEVADKAEEEIQVLNEGVQATIYKGTRGLPEGEDWKTYEGDPISVIGGGLGDTALSHLGVPYSKWDCVDLVRNVYREMGITLPRSHSGIQHFGVGVSYANAKKGDIICYKRHVGIYLGDGKMVHSTSSSGGVHVGKVNTSKIVTVRRYVGN